MPRYGDPSLGHPTEIDARMRHAQVYALDLIRLADSRSPRREAPVSFGSTLSTRSLAAIGPARDGGRDHGNPRSPHHLVAEADRQTKSQFATSPRPNLASRTATATAYRPASGASASRPLRPENQHPFLAHVSGLQCWQKNRLDARGPSPGQTRPAKLRGRFRPFVVIDT